MRQSGTESKFAEKQEFIKKEMEIFPISISATVVENITVHIWGVLSVCHFETLAFWKLFHPSGMIKLWLRQRHTSFISSANFPSVLSCLITPQPGYLQSLNTTKQRKSHTYRLFHDSTFLELSTTARQAGLTAQAAEQAMKREMKARCGRRPTADV